MERSFPVYQQLSADDKYAYKLIQLPPDLVQYIESDKDAEVVIKAPPAANATDPQNRLVLCTPDHAWKLRQMNHSNSVLLMDDLRVNNSQKSLSNNTPANAIVGFTQTSYEYELSDVSGSINVSNIPVYSGDKLSDDTVNRDCILISVQELLDVLPICRLDFYREWFALGGTEIEGNAHIMLDAIITEILSTIIVSLLGNSVKVAEESFPTAQLLQQITNQVLTREMAMSVIHKFAASDPSSDFALDNRHAARWFGTQLLCADAGASIITLEFLVQWKLSLPEFYNVPLDIKDLRGHFMRPQEGRVQYLNPKSLSKDVSMRFIQLFQLCARWDYDDFVPFIEDFVPKDKKVDSLILKHARKTRKKVGTKETFIVCSR